MTNLMWIVRKDKRGPGWTEQSRYVHTLSAMPPRKGEVVGCLDDDESLLFPYSEWPKSRKKPYWVYSDEAIVGHVDWRLRPCGRCNTPCDELSFNRYGALSSICRDIKGVRTRRENIKNRFRVSWESLRYPASKWGWCCLCGKTGPVEDTNSAKIRPVQYLGVSYLTKGPNTGVTKELSEVEAEADQYQEGHVCFACVMTLSKLRSVYRECETLISKIEREATSVVTSNHQHSNDKGLKTCTVVDL